MDTPYSMVIRWSDEDNAYIVTLPEFGGCKTHGETYDEAVRHGQEVLDLLTKTYVDSGCRLPDPATCDGIAQAS